jgi:PleD family two-component response regulator
LIEAADKALFTAKHGVRDQAIVDEPGITKES